MPPAPPSASVHVAFETFVPVVSNRYLWWDCVRILMAAFLVAGIGVLSVAVYDQDYSRAPDVFLLLGVSSAALLALATLAGLVLFPKGYRRCFRIGGAGVVWESRPEPAATPGPGVMQASPQVAGTPLLARSPRARVLPWSQIRAIHLHPSTGVMCFLNSWRVVVRVYCPPYAYAAATDAVRLYATVITEPPIRIRES
jgi:hypothetical protein